MHCKLQRAGSALATIAMCCMLVPTPVLAAEADLSAIQVAPQVLDVKLDGEGVLRGAVAKSSGQPHEGALVTLALGKQAVATAEANREGQFAFKLLRGGVYQIAAGDQVVTLRAWPEAVAPPAAKERLLVVSDMELARGQRPLGEAIFSTPVLVGAVIIAAIAIPLALNSSDDSPTGS